MPFVRRLLGDRVSGGVCAALAGYFLLLQAFVAAFTCAMTVPVEAGPYFVLCLPAQPQAEASAGTEQEDAGFRHECPCVVCHAFDGDLTASLAPGGDLGPAFAPLDRPLPLPRAEPALRVDPSRLGLAPAPRGPPATA